MTSYISMPRSLDVNAGDMVVYPVHGIGRITATEQQEVAGFRLELFVVFFEKDRLTLRVPTAKAASVGMRRLADPPLVQSALGVLSSRARVRRTMWSRRATEYQAKINSGDLIAAAEVVRYLYRSPHQPEGSYRERELCEAALDMLWREIALVNNISETEARRLIQQNSTKPSRLDKGAPAEAKTHAEGGREEAA